MTNKEKAEVKVKFNKKYTVIIDAKTKAKMSLILDFGESMSGNIVRHELQNIKSINKE